MFPYPEQYPIAAPPITTGIMVLWALIAGVIFPPASLIALVPLYCLFPAIILMHCYLTWQAQGMKRLDQVFYGLVHIPLAFVVWTFTIMHLNGDAFS